jgi:hypothetical protein
MDRQRILLLETHCALESIRCDLFGDEDLDERCHCERQRGERPTSRLHEAHGTSWTVDLLTSTLRLL